MCVVYDGSNSMKVVNIKNIFLAICVTNSFKILMYTIYYVIYCDSLEFRLGLNDYIKNFVSLFCCLFLKMILSWTIA